MQKLTPEDQAQIISLIKKKESQTGSLRAVATFCNVSPAVISQVKENKYEVKGNDMWLKIGLKLGWHPNTKTGIRDWVTVETRDCRSIAAMVMDAKNNSLFLAVAECAGIGKSESLKHCVAMLGGHDVFYIRCMDWGKKEFMERLCRTLGIGIGSGYKNPNDLLDLVIEFFQNRAGQKPLLIVDEANKLKDAALRCIIPMYNECEDYLGVVLAGPDDLERNIVTGVRYQRRGFDEIYSRFGRTFIKLVGSTLNDVVAICKANGYTDSVRIKEKFEQHRPSSRVIMIEGKEVRLRVIKDLRWVKTLVKVNRNKTRNHAA